MAGLLSAKNLDRVSQGLKFLAGAEVEVGRTRKFTCGG